MISRERLVRQNAGLIAARCLLRDPKAAPDPQVTAALTLDRLVQDEGRAVVLLTYRNTTEQPVEAATIECVVFDASGNKIAADTTVIASVLDGHLPPDIVRTHEAVIDLHGADANSARCRVLNED